MLYDEDTENVEDDEQAGGHSALIWDEQTEGLTDLLEEDEGHVSLSSETSREQFVWGKEGHAPEAAVYI